MPAVEEEFLEGFPGHMIQAVDAAAADERRTGARRWRSMAQLEFGGRRARRVEAALTWWRGPTVELELALASRLSMLGDGVAVGGAEIVRLSDECDLVLERGGC